MEIWKEVVEFPNYLVSDLGKIKNKKTGRILKCRKTSLGYNRVRLYGEKTRNVLVHRLVANAFIPNPNNYLEVNHKDENKLNNCVNNLEWCTKQYNMNYGKAPIARKTKLYKKVAQYDMNGFFIKEYNSIKEAQEENNVFQISRVCNGLRKQCGGYVWKFVKGGVI